jgi:photosystem II stability/assembly factor-like uncharacterized protein
VRVNAFASLGGTLFAGTDSGIFKSHDKAQSWWPATGVAMSSGRIVGFATLGRKVFAGTIDRGMLVSTNEGKSWALNAALPAQKVRCLLAHRGRLYVGTDAEGVFVSNDTGQNWVSLFQDFPADAQVFALSAVEDRVFAGLYSKGLYSWNEQEHRWTKAGSISPLVLASIDDTLVAGQNPGGLNWSADLGVSWSKGAARTAGQFTLELFNGTGELSNEAAVWELAAYDELVIAGASTGIYYSEDRGRTWTRARAGLPSESPGVSFLLEKTFVLAGTTISSASGEPDSSPNGSQSIPSEINTTSSAAGSRR